MMLPLAASAYGIEIDGIFYNFSSNKTAEVTHKEYGLKYTGDVVIPSSVTKGAVEYNVTGIAANAFSSCPDLISVTIPKSVTNIGKDLFLGSTGLASIIIEEGNPNYDSRENCNAIIETASNKILFGCKGTVIPNSVTTIGQNAFKGCTGLSSISIPSSVTTIERSAFQSCSGLTSLIIPDGVTSIEGSAFSGCYGLTFVSLGAGLDNIGYGIFENCSNLRTAEINNNALVSKNYTQNEDNVGMIFAYAPVEEYILGEDVTSIGDWAFNSCNMTSVKMSDNVTSIGKHAFYACTRLTSIELSNNLTFIGEFAFAVCQSLPSITIPQSVRCIDNCSFQWCYILTKVVINSNEVVSREHEQYYALMSCFGSQVKEYVFGEDVKKIAYMACFDNSELTTVTILGNVTCVEDSAFHKCTSITDFYCYAEQVPETGKDVFVDSNYKNATLHVPAGSIDAYSSAEQWKDFGSIVALPDQEMVYRPFVEEGKVWKVGDVTSGNPVQRVDYYYFDGDTIIDRKICKQMMCQRYVSPSHPDYEVLSRLPSQITVGAWYEEDKKVYEYDTTNKQFKLMYDFSLDANGIFQTSGLSYVVGPRQTGGIKGFKGVYRDVWECGDEGSTFRCAPWLEGVGGIYGPPTTNVFNVELGDPAWFLMSCTVGDEVIYLNDEYEDGTTPVEARRRFDFTHTIKTQPKAPRKEMGARASSPAESEQTLYGEYNNLQLDINLDPLDDTYQVRITDETGKVVYEKSINAASIVGLNIDISAYPEGRYTVTVENSRESFIGEFETQATGIKENVKIEKLNNERIYNLQGQRINTLQKGLNIVNGQKVFVK